MKTNLPATDFVLFSPHIGPTNFPFNLAPMMQWALTNGYPALNLWDLTAYLFNGYTNGYNMGYYQIYDPANNIPGPGNSHPTAVGYALLGQLENAWFNPASEAVAANFVGPLNGANITDGTLTEAKLDSATQSKIDAASLFLIRSNPYPAFTWAQLGSCGCIDWMSNNVLYKICTNSLSHNASTNLILALP